MKLTINGEPIDSGLIEQEFSQIKAHFEQLGNISCCERDEEFRGYARDNIVARVLLAQEAERVVERVSDAEISATIEQLMKDHGGESQFAAATGFTPDKADMLRENVQTNLRMQKLVQQLCAGDGEPDEADLKKYYEEHLDHFRTIEQVRASHILKAPKRGEEREGAYQQLRKVREELLEGADFNETAKQHSDKPPEETDLGFFKRGELMEEFEFVAFSLRIGEISPVFGSPFGFHIVKLTDRKPATAKPFEEVRDQVNAALMQERQQKRVQKLVEQLKKRATIETDEPEKAACAEHEAHAN